MSATRFPPDQDEASRRTTADLPHLLFAGAIAAWSAWFCLDAWSAAQNVENLILIVPATVLVLVLFACVAVGCLRTGREARRRPVARGLGLRIAGAMALLALFAAAGPLAGFDVATLAYIVLMLLLGGERRPLVLLLVPVLFCAGVIYCFGTLLDTPLPTLLGPLIGPFFGLDPS